MKAGWSALSKMREKTSTNRIEELDALRGIAALMVVLFHYNLLLVEKSVSLLKLGVTGVDLFFMISGFVIYMSLAKINTGFDFAINRVSRLYPTYWICVSITFLFFCFHHIAEFNLGYFTQYLKNMTMFQFYLKSKNIDESYWTLIVEMLFYLGILFLLRFNWLKHIYVIGISLCLLIVILTHFFYQIYLVEKLIYYIPLLPFMPLFFSGIIFYKIYTEKNQLLKRYSIIILCAICQILLFNFGGKSRYIISQSEYIIMIIIFFSLFTLFVNHSLGFLVSKISLFFGDISFALYLIHAYIAQEIFIPFLVKNLNINFWIASFLIAFPLMVAIATFITYYIEKPLSKKMKEKLRSLKNNKIESMIIQ